MDSVNTVIDESFLVGMRNRHHTSDHADARLRKGPAMTKILLVTSSPRSDSASTSIALKFISGLATQSRPELVTHRALRSMPLPHLDSSTIDAIRKAPEQRTAEEAAAAALSDELVDELQHADVVIIATGLINFGIESSLKSWIDHVARAGVTFRYTENGPEGLLKNKKAYLALASGGIYSDGPAASMDHAVPYLRTVLGFLGITDVEVVRAEGLAYGEEAAGKALAGAHKRAEEIAAAA